MKNLRLYLLLAFLHAGVFSVAYSGDNNPAHAGVGSDPQNFNSFSAPAYQLPDPAAMSPSAASGKEQLSCTSCHVGDGTQPNASPLIVVAKKYPAPGLFNSRSNMLLDVAGRVNGCFERSLVGEPLPRDSQRCHQQDGAGVWREDEKRFRYPAVWGLDSFGQMSSMGRLATTATMVYATMPRDRIDVMDVTTRMSQEDAGDVSAYILSKSHPFKEPTTRPSHPCSPGPSTPSAHFSPSMLR